MSPSPYAEVCEQLRSSPRVWLVTGAAGFIGSSLTRTLLELGQTVLGLDNFATGHRENLPSNSEAGTFEFVEGDIRNASLCRELCEKADVVLHQAALGSVPRSIADPMTSHEVNTTGFANVALACRADRVQRLVYASSSSVYGDHPDLPKVEGIIGWPLSPYAATKRANELYARAFAESYDLRIVGLRYFNVFGPRQDPDGAYAAVIPRWIARQLRGEPCEVHGDGETTRDFCYIDNAVQANILAGAADIDSHRHEVFNVACGARITLNELHELIASGLDRLHPERRRIACVHKDSRPGDVRHSLANIDRAQRTLGYRPTHDVARGLEETLTWFSRRHRS